MSTDLERKLRSATQRLRRTLDSSNIIQIRDLDDDDTLVQSLDRICGRETHARKR